MAGLIFDSNILIDQLRAIEAARQEIGGDPDRAISIVTWIELLAGASAEDEHLVHILLDDFETVAIDEAIAKRAAMIRRELKIKLPDAVIWATAQVRGELLVTRNTKDFPADDPGVRIPYQL